MYHSCATVYYNLFQILKCQRWILLKHYIQMQCYKYLRVKCYAASLWIAVALFLSMAPFFHEWSQIYSLRSGNLKLIFSTLTIW